MLLVVLVIVVFIVGWSVEDAREHRSPWRTWGRAGTVVAAVWILTGSFALVGRALA